MNIPPVSIAAAKAALIEQFANPVLRRRASMLWGTRGVGKSSIVRQVAAAFRRSAGRSAPDHDRAGRYPRRHLCRRRAGEDGVVSAGIPARRRRAGRHPVPRRAHRRRPAAADLGLFADPRPPRRQLPAAGRLAGHRRGQRQLPRRGQPRHGHRARRPHVPFQCADRDRRLPRPCHREGFRAGGHGLSEGSPRQARRHPGAARRTII